MNYVFKYRKYSEALYVALKDDAFYIAMEKSISNGSPKEAMIRYLDYSLAESVKYGELVIPGSNVFGASAWAKPLDENVNRDKLEQKMIFIESYMGLESLETYNSIINFMSDNAAPLIDAEAWYLSIIGIAPQFQGQGLGASLLKTVLHKSDELGVSTYLETFTPRNMKFYNRMGYETVESFYEPTAGSDYWIMERKVA